MNQNNNNIAYLLKTFLLKPFLSFKIHTNMYVNEREGENNGYVLCFMKKQHRVVCGFVDAIRIEATCLWRPVLKSWNSLKIFFLRQKYLPLESVHNSYNGCNGIRFSYKVVSFPAWCCTTYFIKNFFWINIP